MCISPCACSQPRHLFLFLKKMQTTPRNATSPLRRLQSPTPSPPPLPYQNPNRRHHDTRGRPRTSMRQAHWYTVLTGSKIQTGVLFQRRRRCRVGRSLWDGDRRTDVARRTRLSGLLGYIEGRNVYMYFPNRGIIHLFFFVLRFSIFSCQTLCFTCVELVSSPSRSSSSADMRYESMHSSIFRCTDMYSPGLTDHSKSKPQPLRGCKPPSTGNVETSGANADAKPPSSRHHFTNQTAALVISRSPPRFNIPNRCARTSRNKVTSMVGLVDGGRSCKYTGAQKGMYEPKQVLKKGM